MSTHSAAIVKFVSMINGDLPEPTARNRSLTPRIRSLTSADLAFPQPTPLGHCKVLVTRTRRAGSVVEEVKLTECGSNSQSPSKVYIYHVLTAHMKIIMTSDPRFTTKSRHHTTEGCSLPYHLWSILAFRNSIASTRASAGCIPIDMRSLFKMLGSGLTLPRPASSATSYNRGLGIGEPTYAQSSLTLILDQLALTHSASAPRCASILESV